MAVTTIMQTRSVFDWLIRAVVSLTCYLVIEMRNDVKKLTETVPVMQEQIRIMQIENAKFDHKLFSHYPAKKEEEINLYNLLNSDT